MKTFSEWLKEWGGFDPQRAQAVKLITDLRHVTNYLNNPGSITDYGRFSRMIEQLHGLLGNAENTNLFKVMMSSWAEVAEANSRFVSQSGRASPEDHQAILRTYNQKVATPLWRFMDSLDRIQQSTGVRGGV